MKRLAILLLSIIIITPNVYAEESISNKVSVSLIKCDSTSNIVIKKDTETLRVSMIAYDKSDGSLNKEIDNYVCNKLNNSTNIQIEYDNEITTKDKYNREQIWLYVDDELLQEDLIKNGYGQVNYVTGNYKYLNELCLVQKDAIKSSLGIWKYEGIKEEYCNSGISIGNTEEQVTDDQENDDTNISEILDSVLIYNIGILLLVLLLIKRVNYGKKR